VRGRARLTGPRTVTVNDTVFTARRAVVLNPGTEPVIPPIPGLANTPYWTNREAAAATEAPESLVVIGGGAVGLELAQAFARFGAQVTVLEAAGRLLPTEEPEAGELLAQVLREEGLGVHLGAKVRAVGHSGDAFTVELDDGPVRAHRLLVATGRHTDLKALGVDAVGCDAGARFLEPDERMRIADGVYAIGDVTGKGAFTHISMYQAAIVTREILGRPGPGAAYHAVPRVTFTDPEVGAVGLTEAQSREHGLAIQVGFTELPSSVRGWIHKAGNRGFVKLVHDVERGVLLGATSAGPTGGEVLSALAVAVHAQVPTDTLKQMIYAYPTFHRAIEDALAQLS
jgi:pyruvate/2-oxoglutarate dehydrogenase complex dihydrolipoamide dehydrogenase (E3) component